MESTEDSYEKRNTIYIYVCVWGCVYTDTKTNDERKHKNHTVIYGKHHKNLLIDITKPPTIEPIIETAWPITPVQNPTLAIESPPSIKNKGNMLNIPCSPEQIQPDIKNTCNQNYD